MNAVQKIKSYHSFINKAKQINILGSRQHPAEKVALWCEFKKNNLARSNRDILMPTNMHLMVYEQYKLHLSVVCDM